ncbi:hypothetical protein [Spirosoma agri]|uniref:Uncharacterized protein n=1 Tax=Spirosoma agri TaxID=1987381 RepID=A0A6M0IG17_9BACT|nr:hypothetical protein [Spirosoma agri]NEU65963.1 hypothetical protein [Spirosoma agri]
MKLFFLLLVISITGTYGQSALYGEKLDSPLTLRNGLVIVVGDTIHFGKGTLPNGDFNYITRSGKTPLTRQWCGRYAIVQAIRGNERKKYIVVRAGRTAVIDITAAISVAEIVGINKSSLTLTPVHIRGDYR